MKNLMKTSFSLTPCLVLATLLVGCRPERIQTSMVNPRKVSFTQAGVSLVVGEEWKGEDLGAVQGLYPPTLVSQAGRIRVVLLPPDRSDPDVVANGLRAAFDRNPQSAKHTFRRQQFANDNGVRGLHVSYLQQVGPDGGGPVVENTHYLVKNRAGRCVAINYMASSDISDTAPINRMLRGGLSLQ
jgi:hypothetical protein